MNSPAAQPDSPRAAVATPAAEQSVGPARPVHLYDAVSTQRDHVLGSFDTQRAAILKAVADQREAALAPIKSVQSRQAAPSSTAPNTATRGQPSPQSLVAAEIVSHLKAMVAEEVRLQLLVLLEAATARHEAITTHNDKLSSG